MKKLVVTGFSIEPKNYRYIKRLSDRVAAKTGILSISASMIVNELIGELQLNESLRRNVLDRVVKEKAKNRRKMVERWGTKYLSRQDKRKARGSNG